MSYTGKESLKEIMNTLKAKYPELVKMLRNGVQIRTLHGVVEMLAALIVRYDRGEIVEKVEQDNSDR